MSNDYNPRPHSLGSRVCAWFKANPTARLSSREIADQFDGRPLHVSSQLGAAEDADLLTSERENGLNVYSAGPKLAGWTPPPQRRRRAAAQRLQGLPRPHRPGLGGGPAPSGCPPRPGEPGDRGRRAIPPARTSTAAYEARFAEMTVGQSIPLATPAAKRLISTAQRFGKTCGRKFITRALPADPNTSRIWRTE